MAVIEVSDLRCTYGDHVAVDGIDFTVQRGEIFALLGANGAGKTTTLETLEGHQAPASGSVRLFGHDPRAQRRAVRRRTGVMLQDGGFAGELTVRETADLWAKLSRRDGDVETDLDRLDLTGRADVPVQQLSGGETRRLEVALAIHGQPELLIFDEPTTGLDPESRRRTWQVIGELVDGGVDDPAHHALPGGGRGARGPRRDHARRPDRRRGQPRRGLRAAPGPDRVPGAGAVRSRPSSPRCAPTAASASTCSRRTRCRPTSTRLLEWANAHGLTLERLHARGGSLEDAFMGVLA